MMYSNNKVRFFAPVCLVVTAFFMLIADAAPLTADTLTIGGKDGWEQLAARNGVAETTGRFGYTAITLATDGQTVDALTDLLLDFDGESFSDKTGNYMVQSNTLRRTPQAIRGNGAAFSRGTGGMVLSGRTGSLFGTAGPVGSFTISFWIAPATASGNEVILNWRSSISRADGIDYQQVNAAFAGGKLQWTFYNIFNGAPGDNGDIRITGSAPLIPEQWSFHVLSFDEETGLLEYRVNGIIEALEHITATGHGRGGVYNPYFGAPSVVTLCPSYLGRIDDFAVVRRPYTIDDAHTKDAAPALRPTKYRGSGGRIETAPLLTTVGARLTSVTAIMNVPEQTAVRLFARGGDTYFNWTETEPAWQPITSGNAITGIQGRYFQIAADLYPDGAGNSAPSITELPPDIPLPPFTIQATAGNGSVTLRWSRSVDETADGYYVYYGTRPGEYLGRRAAQGASPIDVGNRTTVTITGLENNQIYYFSIAAWTNNDDRLIGTLSREVYARPGIQ